MKANNVLRLILGCSMLLIAVAAFAQSTNTGQASITLLSCNVGSCYSDNTSWSLGKCEGTGCPALPTTPNPNTSYSGGGPGAGSTSETITLDANGNTPSPGINWNVAATKVATSGPVLKVFGFMYMQNTGAQTAYLGNFVANLQKKSGNTWPSAAADIADSTNGNSALQVNICSPADSNSASSFTPNAGSGTLKLWDQNGNDLTAFPSTLAAGATLLIQYEADYNINAIGLQPGAQVRMEAIVTFANSGARGGSGASCTNASSSLFGSTDPSQFTDINGDGIYESNEYYYRSVPCRTTFTIPALSHDNQTVNLSDPMVDGSGNLTFNALGLDTNNGNVLAFWSPWNSSNPTEPILTPLSAELKALPAAGLTAVDLGGFVTAGAVAPNGATITSASTNPTSFGSAAGTLLNATINPSASFSVNAYANSTGVAGIDNCAKLVNPNGDDIVHVTDIQGYFPNGFNFTCSKAVNLEACAWPIVTPDPSTPPPPPAQACTFSQGGWGSKPNGLTPGYYLAQYFDQVYGSDGLKVGGNGGPYTMTFKTAPQTLWVCTGTGKSKKCAYTTGSTVTGPQAIEAYLPAGGQAGALTQSLTNPNYASAGEFGGQVVTLQLSLDFAKAGVVPGWSSLANVMYHNVASCENGHTVSRIVSDANTLLGGGNVTGCTIQDLDAVLGAIVTTFDGPNGCAAVDGITFTSN